MKKLVDNSKFTIIDTVALRQTRYLKKYYIFSQLNGEKEEASFTYLKRLVAGEEEELPDRIITLLSELGRAHFGGVSDVQTVGGKQVHISQLVWGRLCVAAYFFYYGEAVWQQVVFGKLEERIIVPELKEDLLRAKTLMDAYYEEKGIMTKGGDERPVVTKTTATESKIEAAASVLPQTPSVDKKTYCKYIVKNRFPTEDYTLDEFEDRLRVKSEATAPEFCSFLEDCEKKKLLDFTVDYEDVSTIHIQLQKHFPTMRKYSYQNFHNYFKCRVKNKMI